MDKKSLKVKIFLNLFGTYKKVSNVCLVYTTDDRVKDLHKKANSNLRALGRVLHISPYVLHISLGKKKLLINSFFAAQFIFCPLIWLFHSRSNNNKITHLHERCL